MKIVTINDKEGNVLKELAANVFFPLDKDTRQFIKEFEAFFFRLDEEHGAAGLAATQVGKSLCMFIVTIPEEAKHYRDNVFDVMMPTLFINPRYEPVIEEGMRKEFEGCFSVPDIVAEVYRYNTVKFYWQDVDGAHHERVAKGFFAKAIQHEAGHLIGEIYTELARDDCQVMSMEEYLAIREKRLAQAREG